MLLLPSKKRLYTLIAGRELSGIVILKSCLLVEQFDSHYRDCPRFNTVVSRLEFEIGPALCGVRVGHKTFSLRVRVSRLFFSYTLYRNIFFISYVLNVHANSSNKWNHLDTLEGVGFSNFEIEKTDGGKINVKYVILETDIFVVSRRANDWCTHRTRRKANRCFGGFEIRYIFFHFSLFRVAVIIIIFFFLFFLVLLTATTRSCCERRCPMGSNSFNFLRDSWSAVENDTHLSSHSTQLISW